MIAFCENHAVGRSTHYVVGYAVYYERQGGALQLAQPEQAFPASVDAPVLGRRHRVEGVGQASIVGSATLAG